MISPAWIRSALRLGGSLAMLACGEAASSPPREALFPVAIIDPAADTNWTTIPRVVVFQCDIVGIDAGEQILKVQRSDRSVVRIGRKGSGPGEFRFPRSLAVGPDSVLTIMDLARLRLIRYRVSGEFIDEFRLQGGIWSHRPMGKVLATATMLVDYWYADKVADWFVPDSVLGNRPLVERLAFNGIPIPGGWGRPRVPEDSTDYQLRWLLQSGDIATSHDSLYVLDHTRGVIDIYPLLTQQASPSRSIELTRFRRTTPPSEEGASLATGSRGQTLVRDPKSLSYDPLTSAMAVSQDGKVLVVSRLNGRTSPALPWPPEALAVYSPTGDLLSAYRLPSRGTVSADFLKDGTLVLLGIPDSTQGSTTSVQFYDVPDVPRRDYESCGWY